jgi:hypothetical protein
MMMSTAAAISGNASLNAVDLSSGPVAAGAAPCGAAEARAALEVASTAAPQPMQ